MREIKFRGFDKKYNQWVCGSLVNNLWASSELTETPGKSICEIAIGGDADCWEDMDSCDQIITVDTDSVGQFTGLIDITSKEIFEGDVVSCAIGSGKVIFSAGCFMLEWIDDKEANMELLGMDKHRYAREDLVVVGNIYESE